MLLEARISAGYKGNADVLRDFELSVEPGEIVGLVGESGSGKSTVALALMRLLEFRGGNASGRMCFQGRDLMALPEREMRAVRGRKIALVLQSPLSALNPAMRIGRQIQESWRAHCGSGQASPDLLELLEMVNLPRDRAFLDRYPREISVGQAQRVLIAMAILHRPDLLIADEPTSALDAVTQAEILKLLADLNRRLGMGVLFISHDLLSVASFCHRIAILERGRIVESGPAEQIFTNPRHSYTRSLLAAIPQPAFPHRRVPSKAGLTLRRTARLACDSLSLKPETLTEIKCFNTGRVRAYCSSIAFDCLLLEISMNTQPTRTLIATNQPMLAARFREVLRLAGFDGEPVILRSLDQLAEVCNSDRCLIIADAKLAAVAPVMLARAVRRAPQSHFVVAGYAIKPEMLRTALESGIHGVLSIDLPIQEVAEEVARIWEGERRFRFDCGDAPRTIPYAEPSADFDAAWMFGQAV